MNGKITQTEFKKWSEQILNKASQITSPGAFKFDTEVERQKIMKVGAIGSYWTEQGVILAPSIGILALLQAGLKTDIPLDEFDGLTFDQWADKIMNRLKEHCIANGYYKPSSPSDLALLKERRSKVNKILKDNNEVKKLLNYANEEEKEIVVNFLGFTKAVKDEFPDENSDENDIAPQGDFLFEDLVGRVEKLISKKEEAEKNKPSSPTNNSPNSPTPKPSPEYKSNLETEIGRLQVQIKELEAKVNQADNSTQKQTYQKILDNTKKDLEDKQKEKDKLDGNKETSEPSNKSNNKLNLAIGLGIGAIVIGLICLILIASRKKES